MPLLDPPLIITGEVVIVPIAALELVTGTLAEKPPRNCCVVTKFSDPSSTPTNTVMFGSGAPSVVKKSAPKPNGLAIMKPDDASVTVCVPFPKPGALAVYVAFPLPPSACA